MPRFQEEPLETAFYARYSNKDVQKDTSIEDQFASLERVAPRFNLKPLKKHYYCDRGISGSDAIADRPGLGVDLLRAAKRGEFKALLVEHTDRLSREDSDLLFLKNCFKHYGVKVFTINGEVSDLQWTFESYGNADYSRKLASRVKRGHDTMAEKQRIPTCLSYGYDLADPTRTDLTKRGLRVINEQEAQIIVRMAEEYASGMTPMQITRGLMRDGIPSPSGKPYWNPSAIIGGKGSKRGLLHNRLYIGEYIRNRFTAPKNPITRRREVRPLPADELKTIPMPHLRILSDELWNAVHAVRLKRQHEKFGPAGYIKPADMSRRQGIFSGLLVCAECKGQMIVVASNRKMGQRVACSAAFYRRSDCSHSRSYDLNRLTNGALDKVQEKLTNPALMKEEAKAHAIEAAKLERESRDERRKLEAQKEKLSMQIKRLVDVLADTEIEESGEIRASIKAKETERAAVKQRLKFLPAETTVTPLHAANLENTCRSIDRACEILLAGKTDHPDYREAILGLRNIVGSIVVFPVPRRATDYEIEIFRRRHVIENGLELFPAKRSLKEIVQTEGVRNDGSAGTASSRRPSSRHSTGW